MQKPSPYLTFAGTIPFIACAIFIAIGVDTLTVLGEVTRILSVYGLVIASFMAGAQWGNHLSLVDTDPWALKLPIFSNVIALALWLGYLTLSIVGFIWLLIVGFLSLLVIDYGLSKAKVIGESYFTVRKYVTLIVVISLMLAVMNLG